MLQCVWTQSRMLRPGVDAGLHVPFQTWSGSLASSQPLQLRCRVTVSGDSVVLAEWSPHAIVHSHAMLCALQVTAMGAPGAFTMHVWCVEMGIGARGRARPRVAQHVRRGRVMGAERGTGGPLSRVDDRWMRPLWPCTALRTRRRATPGDARAAHARPRVQYNHCGYSCIHQDTPISKQSE